MAHNTLLPYSDFNKQLYIDTDARNLQLGVFINKEVIPISFKSSKGTSPQKIYTVTEK